MQKYSVSELAMWLKQIIGKEFRNEVTVTGEISGFKVSGKNTFLTLKDEESCVDCCFWQSALTNSTGEHVEITGKIDYYPKTGRLNFIGKRIKNVGIGVLHKEYEELFEKYKSMGYFDNKKPLPKTVRNIGIITSQDGAALQDFLYVLRSQKFIGTVYIYNCIAQGPKCASTVANGIRYFDSPITSNNTIIVNNLNESNEEHDENSQDSNESEDPFKTIAVKKVNPPKGSLAKDTLVKDTLAKEQMNLNDMGDIETVVDLIVITRGGGSFEDLMGFSDPKIIEAIYRSKRYTISAVGHEIDMMLSDHVANYRAPTPSIAGEVVAKISMSKMNRLDSLEHEMEIIHLKISDQLRRYKEFLIRLKNSIIDPYKDINQRIDRAHEKTRNLIKNKLSRMRSRLDNISKILAESDLPHILDQGFVLFTDQNTNILKDTQNIFDQNIMMHCSTGTYNIRITKTN